ncbi:hypothetical protein ROHU_009473 [Labeo rohita]|uniref:Uncharacterized protein n=1 Tax=Labeo rohita TaxID=84645 RepID=A0A498LSI6_LABRO|nr:hypothetical protein ROHU_011577 [Labeo rohita]RXN13740.1 hypothetical protein ROHU_009473 [Labeo rohita]
MPFASSSPLAIRQEDDEMLIKECCACGGPVELPDAHDACVFCLGRVHTEAVLDGPDCPICEEMTVKTLRARVSVILNCVPANPLDDARDLVSFGAAEDDLDDDDDAMSTAASGSGDWSACLESEASHSEILFFAVFKKARKTTAYSFLGSEGGPGASREAKSEAVPLPEEDGTTPFQCGTRSTAAFLTAVV